MPDLFSLSRACRFQDIGSLATVFVIFSLLFPSFAQAAGPERGPAVGTKIGIIERPRPVGKSGPGNRFERQAADETSAESAQSVARPDASEDNREDELKREYSKVLQDIIHGIYEGDYSRFARNLTEQMRVTQNRQAFLNLQSKIQTNLGKLQSLDYLGFYSQGGSNMALFKAKFSKDNDDVLITLVFDRGSSSKQASGMWLDSPALER